LRNGCKTTHGLATPFFILADHCASSAGKTKLPVDKYRIPAMITVLVLLHQQNTLT
jgi:hypothetical protein